MKCFNHKGEQYVLESTQDRAYGQPTMPFALGTRGRGRTYEEVRFDMRRPPTTPDVGFATFEVGGRKHCVLTAPSGQPGLLLRCNSEGTYTRDSGGGSRVLYGHVTVVASGSFAFGAAGRIGGGTDILYHVVGQAIVRLVLTGGEYKGFGARYVFVDSTKNYVRCLRPRDLIQEVATDEDPVLTEILRGCPENGLDDTLREAQAASVSLEAAADASPVDTMHYPRVIDQDIVGGEGWRLPPNHTGGLARSGVDGVLVPGASALVCVTVGPGGGKRYDYEVLDIEGLDVLSRRPIRTSGNHCSLECIVALTTDPAWIIRWSESKDGAETGLYTADPTGCRGMEW
jgi:hypothetical protein